MTSDPTPGFPLAASRWPWWVAVAFVVVTLVALVIVPWLVQERVNDLRAGLEASEPARTHMLQWQFVLAREMGALNQALLERETTSGLYAESRANEDRITRRLAVLSLELGPEVYAEFVRARTLAESWHARIPDEEKLRDQAVIAPLGGLVRERDLFEETLRAIAHVDSVVVVVGDRRRSAILSAEQVGLRLTGVLGVLALIAAIAVVWLGTRIRRFATEAERRRELADAALAESARAEEARDRVLRGVTHDVKNPLGAARGYAELLAIGAKGPPTEEQRPLIEGIERSIDSALSIMDDLLALARTRGERLEVQPEEVDLNALASEAVSDHEARAQTAGQAITVETGDRPLIAHTDRALLRRVLDNLISNAIKYTPAPGRITVRAETRENGGRPGKWAVLEIADNGPGIPPDQRETVFEEFTQLDNGGGQQGHGLGLAIARGIARRLGGDVTIADVPAGATLDVWIPRREP